MDRISRIFYFFTPYTDPSERTVSTFFKGLTENSDRSHVRTTLGNLLQHNIAVINLWTEYRYKGYRYLGKSERRKLYANLQLITEDFERFARNRPRLSSEAITSYVHELAPHTVADSKKVLLLQSFMEYLSPNRGLYEYRDASSFGRLLRNPAHEKLIGDCNQIVTLYIYLYARYYDVHDLQVRVLPGHVALHYNGIDIETTTGNFANYDGVEGGALLPLEEIVSINLLDTTDSYLSTHEIAAADLLQASRFAFTLSHNRKIVTHNLDVAYRKLVSSLMERHNYRKALEYATASRSIALLEIVGHNGAVYEMEHHNYAAARRFAQHAQDRDALIRNSWHAEGAYHYEARRYHDAIKAFEHTGDQALVRQCYEALFFQEQEKLNTNLTTSSIKEYAGTIKRMHAHAQKSGNKKLIEHADSLKKYL